MDSSKALLRVQVTIIEKKIIEVGVPSDIPEKVDLLITDSFDYGLLGEGTLATFAIARDNILKGIKC